MFDLTFPRENDCYIVLEYRSVFPDWYVIPESKKGVTKVEAEEICQYNIRYCKKARDRLLIVPVPRFEE